ncbi:MAG: DegT/DnrJ/EryC1/StrS family aminotransferase, partial [Candidatus Omnitrophota bacterium]|nr:DegT/DnrJ/EryC1/StrS family aminotransferase [Candidatus Omnitrophota bacterium]
CRHVYNIYNIRTKNRDGLRDFLASKQVSTAVYYPIPLHLQKVYDSLGYKKGDFPNSESASLEVLALPIFPELKEEEIKFVASSISDFLS